MFATELLIKRAISYCVVIILNEGFYAPLCRRRATNFCLIKSLAKIKAISYFLFQ